MIKEMEINVVIYGIAKEMNHSSIKNNTIRKGHLRAMKGSDYSLELHESKNAITLWSTDYETVKVHITSEFVKFYMAENFYMADGRFTCYTYPPLHILKKDATFIKEMIDTMEEANMYDTNMKEEMRIWMCNTCDMPPFPISVIFTSDYQNYKFKDFED